MVGTSHLLLHPQSQLCEQGRWHAEMQGCGDAGMRGEVGKGAQRHCGEVHVLWTT